MLNVEKLSPDLEFGAIVRGVTLKNIEDETIREQLRKLWIDVGLIIFKDSDTTTELQIKLSKVFGPLERHFQEERLVEGQPELIAFSSKLESTTDVDGKALVGFIPWHGDFRWNAQPNHGGILRVHKMPKSGGDTGFVDLIWSYDTLPQELKKRIEGVEVIYRLTSDDNMYRYYPGHKFRTIDDGPSLAATRSRPRTDFPAIAQPLVYTQKQTGRKVLNYSPLPAEGVLGMEKEVGDALLMELSTHIMDESRAYFHHWGPTDMALWDNLRMLHQACGVPVGDYREVWRTTIASPEPLGRKLEDGGWEWKGKVDAA